LVEGHGPSGSHWHLVSHGLTELHGKESPDRYVSGWGFELTFRLAGTEEEPLWAVDMLANLAAYVWTSGHPFAPGHNVDLRGPIHLDTTSVITAAAVIVDPELGQLAGPYGALEFLQIVGLTADELELCRSWSTEGVIELLARDNPLLVTSLDRASLLEDPIRRLEAGERAAGDGSALTELRVGTLRRWRRLGRGAVLEMGAGTSVALGPALRRELIANDASFRVVGDDTEVYFAVADGPSWSWQDAGIEISVPLDDVEDLAQLFDGRTGWDHRPAYKGLRFHVVP
jgi:hypothetical protein